MNKKNISTILGLLFIPAGAILLNACGPQAEMDSELALDSASDNIMYGWPRTAYTEYGRCNDAWDNDGNGLVDSHDPACEKLGPMRDLSTESFPLGHNFAPDVKYIPVTSPGVPGGFRNRAQMTRWFRFLTETDGTVAGIKLLGPGVNRALVPIPDPLLNKIRQGTAAQGNNNNIDIRSMYLEFPDQDILPLPKTGKVSDEFAPKSFKNAYNTTGSFYKGGSQGYAMPVKTGNEDSSSSND